MTDHIDLVDLSVRRPELDRTLETIARVLERGWFVLGPEVSNFEAALASSVGVPEAVGVASGTDALILGLRAMGVGAGDEVIVPDFTAFPTAAAVVEVGATPVLVDVEVGAPVLSLEATSAALTDRTRAVVLVHLYGIVGDAEAFLALLEPRGIALIEDCAQAQGALHRDGRSVGALGAFGSFSFYPTKNLGAVGDGGAIVTSDHALADEVRVWRSHGERGERYRHLVAARNSRLDDLHAAVLADRLIDLPQVLERRRAVSEQYDRALPAKAEYASHGPDGAPHLAVVRVPDRAGLAAHLRQQGIASGIHYPMPLSDQPALHGLARATAAPSARRWADRCLSLPLHPRLEPADVDRVIAAAVEWHRA